MFTRFSRKYNKRGYVALMAVLIISFILLSISITTSFVNFYNISGILNRELKEISYNTALACLDQAVVKVIQSSNWRPGLKGVSINLGDYSCSILKIEKQSNDFVIETESQVRGVKTNIKAIFDKEDIKLISIEEI